MLRPPTIASWLASKIGYAFQDGLLGLNGPLPDSHSFTMCDEDVAVTAPVPRVDKYSERGVFSLDAKP